MTSDREEEFDRISYEIFWDLATSHPESGVCKMSCIEYHDIPLEQVGILRDGRSEVWFKDVVHDVTFHVSWVQR